MTQQLITVPTVADGLAALGVSAGATLMVHCSLSSFGRIQGGSQTVVEALTKTVVSSRTKLAAEMYRSRSTAVR